MTWQAVTHRTRQTVATLKRHASTLRARITLRVVAWSLAGLVGLSFVAIATEALIRAHITPAVERLPTAIYTRPVPWSSDGDASQAAPVAIGTLDGSPMEERVPVPLSEVPNSLVQAVLAVEDQRFFQHHGLDLKRVAGAMIANLRAGGIVQGGSTLTQQLAKNLFLSADRTPIRKLREAAMALVLEMRYSKRQILDAYLNEIYLGQDGARAIHGMGAASRYYLGKDIRRITIPEAAQLAAMISAPNRTSAARHPDAARERRDMVLHLMADQRRISRAVADRAVRTGLTTGEHPTPSLDGRYFRDYAASNVPRGVPARGGAIYTTLDPDMQRAAEHAVAVATARWRSPDVQVAVVAIDPRTGDVLAMVGGRDYGRSQFNRATEAERQPGSAFKPIVALAALDPHNARAAQFTLATTVADEPLTVNMPEGPWQPADYDQGFRGPVTVREAMEQSLNVPFARIGMAVGPDRVVSLAKRMGITSPLRAVPSIALGSSEVTLLELARAYGVLANEGNLVPTRTILAVSVPNAARPVRIDTTVVPREIVDSGVAYLVTSALEGVVTHGTGHALNQDGRYGQIAGKTGTSNDWRDAWFMTYTPDLVVGVWVGFDDGRSLRMPGATAALPVAATFLAQVTPDGGWPDFERPDGIVYAYAPAGDSDEIDCGRREVFLRGTAPPSQGCSAFDVPALRQIEQWSSQMEERAARWLEHMARQIARQGGQ